MTFPLHLLIVEDDENDAELIARTLRRDAFEVEFRRVDTEAAFREALTAREWTLIIADYYQPSFSGSRALQIYAEHAIDIPFIIISGTVGEEVAVEAMRAGAHDYLLKDKLVRLGPLVRRELRDAQSRAGRRRAEAALRESEQRFRLLVENTSDLVTEITPDGEIVYASPNHHQLLGHSSVDLLGRSVLTLVRPEDLEAVRGQLAAGLPELVAYRALNAHQETRWLETAARAFQTHSGEDRFVLLTRDVTERTRAQQRQADLEAQLRQSQKMEAIGTLAGGIAHDFNNLLTGIIGNLQLAQMESPPGHQIATPLQEALTASFRARDLVGQILTFSRRQEHPRSPHDLGAIVSEALRLLRASLPPTVSLATTFAQNTPAVSCEPSQIHQIVMNLGTNASHAMREKGGLLEVEVALAELPERMRLRHPQFPCGPAVCIRFSDTGSGIPAELRDRIFEPFFTTKPVGEGTGLGLAVVHGILENHEGALDVESTVGVGTTFRLFFPPVQSPASPSSSPLDAMPKGQGETVFLVDDEVGVATLGQRMLQKLNYQPVVFTEAEAAWVALQTRASEVRVMITDLAMPGHSGLELGRELLRLNPQAKVILSTGLLRPNDRDDAEAIGIKHTMPKPFTMADFAQALARALRVTAGA